MKKYHHLIVFCYFIFLLACSKEEINLNSKNYFVGNWEIKYGHRGFYTPHYNTVKATFKDNGEFLLYPPITVEGQGPVTNYWKYDERLQELTLLLPETTYHVVEKSKDQFKLIEKNTNNVVTYVKSN